MPRSALLALVLMLALARTASGDSSGVRACRAIAVTQAAVSFPHVRSVRAAVASAQACDWILVAPGVYRGSVTIRTPGLHLRGLDRNRVIVDGAHRVGNGITIESIDVSVENLTVRNFDRRTSNDDTTGTQVSWDGVDGWWGRYLTAYDTGLLGGYGLWASGSRDGGFDQVYASGFDDSGLYVGACRDCHAVIEGALAEHNLIGLAATNASGHFLVEHSRFRGNAVGASFNSSSSDPPPPQLGACTAGRNRSTAPTVTTTRLARCTIFRDNLLLDNNALDVPSNTASVRPGAGIGVELLGSYGDLIAGNDIVDNRNVGVLGLQLPIHGAAHFALAGNRIADNRIGGSQLAIALAAGRGSVDDCLQGNRGEPTVPAELQPFACTHAVTPPPTGAARQHVLALVDRLQTQLAASSPRSQPTPPPQPTMPDPCRGVPANPLCHR